MISQRWNRFRVCWASDELHSANPQPVMKLFPRMFSKFLNDNFEMGFNVPLCWACTTNWLHFGWACVKIGHLLAKHAWKLVTRWLSMQKIVYSQDKHLRKSFRHFLSSPVTRSSVSFSHPSQTSFVPLITYFVSNPMYPVLCLCS